MSKVKRMKRKDNGLTLLPSKVWIKNEIKSEIKSLKVRERKSKISFHNVIITFYFI